MKITKEILEYFKIGSITLENADGKDGLCFLERIDKSEWTFSRHEPFIDSGIQSGNFKELTFIIKFTDSSEPGRFYANLLDFGGNCLKAAPSSKNSSDRRLLEFISGIQKMEQKFESFGRRKEERIKIGKEKAAEFGLSRIEQTLFSESTKIIQPCVVLDASVHGIRIITVQNPNLNHLDTFGIKISFSNPEQSVILKAHKVYEKITKTQSKTFAAFSCQLLEPVHFAWKDRVIKMIESRTAVADEISS